MVVVTDYIGDKKTLRSQHKFLVTQFPKFQDQL